MGAQFVVSKPLGPDAGRFYLIGDSSSVSLVQAALITSCNATGLNEPFTKLVYPIPNGANTTNYPDATEIIQFYRASSFALALDGFNASALPDTTLSAVDALPASVDRAFLQCINSTIASTVPIMDAPQKFKLSSDAIIYIVFGCIIGAILLPFICCWCCGCVSGCVSDSRVTRERKRQKKAAEKAKKAQTATTTTTTAPTVDIEAGPSLSPTITVPSPSASVLTLTTVHSHTSDMTAISTGSPKIALKDSDGKLTADFATTRN